MHISEQLRSRGIDYRKSDWLDIATCPVCARVESPDELTIKEWLHICNHLKSIGFNLINEGLTLET